MQTLKAALPTGRAVLERLLVYLKHQSTLREQSISRKEMEITVLKQERDGLLLQAQAAAAQRDQSS